MNVNQLNEAHHKIIVQNNKSKSVGLIHKPYLYKNRYFEINKIGSIRNLSNVKT